MHYVNKKIIIKRKRVGSRLLFFCTLKREKARQIMAKFKVTVNTDAYKCKRCSKKNWKPGTRNDYMIAINGITRTLYNMREVMWQLELFQGNSRFVRWI